MKNRFVLLALIFVLMTGCVANDPKYSIKPSKESSLSALISHQCLIEVGMLRGIAIGMEDEGIKIEEAKSKLKRELEGKYDFSTTTRKVLAVMSANRILEQIDLMYSGVAPPSDGISPYRRCMEVSNEFVKLRGGDN